MSKKIILPLLLLGLAGGLLFSEHFFPRSKKRSQTLAKKQKLRVSLFENGRIRASRQRIVYAEISGEVAWVIENGTHVKKGDMVVRMTNPDVETELEQQQVEYQRDQAALEDAREDLETFDTQSRTELKVARTELELAKWKLEKLYREKTYAKVTQAGFDMQKSLLEWEKAKNDAEISTKLCEAQIISKADLEKAVSEKTKARLNYLTNKKIYETLKKGANEKRIQEARRSVEEAIRNVSLERKKRQTGLITRRQNLEKAIQEMKKRSMYLTRAEEKKKGETVRAPVEGTVILYDLWKGSGESREPLKVGDQRGGAWDLLKIADTSSLVVRTFVNECDVDRIKTGLPVEIRMVSLPEKVYTGKISRISPFLQDKHRRLDRLAIRKHGIAFRGVVNVEITFDQMDKDISLGHSVTAEIITSEKECLAVPVEAVRADGEKTFCVLSDGKKKEIETGSFNSSLVEITSGLSPGEKVLLKRDAR